jgi:uncharacterized membrane protein
MKTFEVTITERVIRQATVEIEANDWEEAEAIAREGVASGDIELEEDYDDNLEFETEEV